MAEKILVAFDFDHTLIDENSDVYVRKLAPDGKIPQHIKDKYRYIQVRSRIIIMYI